MEPSSKGSSSPASQTFRHSDQAYPQTSAGEPAKTSIQARNSAIIMLNIAPKVGKGHAGRPVAGGGVVLKSARRMRDHGHGRERSRGNGWDQKVVRSADQNRKSVRCAVGRRRTCFSASRCDALPTRASADGSRRQNRVCVGLPPLMSPEPRLLQSVFPGNERENRELMISPLNTEAGAGHHLNRETQHM